MLKNWKKLKGSEIMYQNTIYICLLDIEKFADFQWKTANVSRPQWVYHVIHIFFGSSLGKV